MQIGKWLAALLALTLAWGTLPAVTPVTAAQTSAAAYTDNPYMIEKLNAVLAEYPVGSYFTNDGKPCTCHQDVTCCVTPYGCNCKRMIGNVDLYAWQCFGYARYVFYRCFGFVDYAANADLYVNVGTIAAGEMNEGNLKALLANTKTGAHIRARGRHSMIFLNTDATGFHVLHGNWDNRCGVYLTHFTWSQFIAKYGSVGIEYVKQPKDYPGEEEVDPPFGEVTPPTIEGDVPGTYRITADVLNIRSGPGTNFDRVGQVAEGAEVTVTAVENGWGAVTYREVSGWISLEFAELLEPALTGIRAEWRSGTAPVYQVGDTLDESLLRVTALYSNGKTIVLNRGYSIDYDFSVPGERFVRIWYQGQDTVLTVSVREAAGSTSGSGGAGTTMPVTVPTEPPAPPVVPGDVNEDGVVNTTDARLVLQTAVGKAELTERAAKAADVNGDGVVNTTDARLILQLAVGKITDFLPEETQSDVSATTTGQPAPSATETADATSITFATESTSVPATMGQSPTDSQASTTTAIFSAD